MAKQDLKKRLAEVYKKKACNVSATCTALGISRNTFYDWINKDHQLKEQIEEANEGLIDIVESKLLNQINENQLTAIIFFLKTKGQARGYVEAQNLQHTGRNGGPIEVNRKPGFAWDEEPDHSGDDSE